MRAATEAYSARQELEHKRNRRPLWVAAFITLVYASFSGFQWLTMRQQAATMRQQLNNSEDVQAASVEIQNFRSEGTLTEGTISFDVKNTGQTRANEVVNTTFSGGYDPHRRRVVGVFQGAKPSTNGYTIGRMPQPGTSVSRSI
jgi:hypothetical protein